MMIQESRKRRLHTSVDEEVNVSKIPFMESAPPSDISKSGEFSSYKSTVLRRTHVDGGEHPGVNDVIFPTAQNNSFTSPGQDPDTISEEVVTTDEHGRKIRKIITKKVTRTQRRIVRRKYIDENGEEHIEEIFKGMGFSFSFSILSNICF